VSLYEEQTVPQAQFVEARGLRHHVLTWGGRDDITPHTPPLVMIHGYMDVGRSFQFVVDAMHALGDRRCVVAPDLRGFGLTRTTQDAYWFQDYLGDLDALLDALFPDIAVDLLGHSMGGNMVMQYAGVRPTRIRRLMNLEGFGLPRTEPASAPERLGKWLDELKTPERLLPYATFADVAARLRRNNPRLPADKAEYLARQWAEQRDGEVQLLADPAHKRVNPVLYRVDEMLACFARICAPLLWVEGTGKEHERWWRGAYTKDEFYERLAHVPQVTKAQLEDAGHMLHHDQPEALAALLLTHLSADTCQS